MMYQCESMAKLICRASDLKCDTHKYKNESGNVYCDLCKYFAIENVKHVIMQCPNLATIRDNMYMQIVALETLSGVQILSNVDDYYAFILVKIPATLHPEICIDLLKIIAQYVHAMYQKVLKSKEGIG